MSRHRFSTADLIGPTLLFLGGFLVAVTIALPTLLADQLRLIPLSTDFTTVATTTDPTLANEPDATILDVCSLNTPTARTVGAELVRQQRVVAVQPSDRRRVTVQAGTSIQADHLLIDGKQVDPALPRPGSTPAGDRPSCTDPTVGAVRDRVTLNRESALPDLAGGGSSEIQYDNQSAPVPEPDRRGFTYLMSFDVSTSDHAFFDVTTRRTVPLRYMGDGQVSGHDVARFTALVPDTDLNTVPGAATTNRPTLITRPASWFGVGGDPARQLTATLHHRSEWELSVDTRTGLIVDQHIRIDESYRFDGRTAGVPTDFALPYLRATFRYDERTRTEMTARSSDLANPVVIWGRLVPIATGVLGVVLLIVGLLLLNPARLPERIRRRLSKTAN
ncbi:DUF3068 domain-containing protein [Gordonia sp. NPDC003585]|uniref:DUF3068 domain-containing protein n=1 Tax=Gordonia sp. NPDC003585 TaxID=3154275 RepID=UPI0033A9DC91